MGEHIKYDIDIVTVSNVPTSLVYVVNPSYYHRLLNEGTEIVAGEFIFFQGTCFRESSCWPYGRIWCHYKHLATYWVVDICTSFLVGSTNAYGIFLSSEPPTMAHFLFLCLFVCFLVLYLAAVSPQYLYQDMQKYVVIVLTKLSRRNQSDKFLTNCICIIFERTYVWCS